jgi:WD40 repeat protein
LLSRRHLLAAAGSATVLRLLPGWPQTAVGQTHVISWPSRVIQLAPDEDDQRPPVVTALRLHRAGQLLATAGDDHRIRVWNLTDGTLVQRLEGHTDWVRTVDYSPDGRTLASAGNDRQICLWSAASGAKLEVLPLHQAPIASIRYSPDGMLLSAVGFEGSVRTYDTQTKQLLAKLPAPCEDMRALAFSPDGQLLAAGGRC